MIDELALKLLHNLDFLSRSSLKSIYVRVLLMLLYTYVQKTRYVITWCTNDVGNGGVAWFYVC